MIWLSRFNELEPIPPIFFQVNLMKNYANSCQTLGIKELVNQHQLKIAYLQMIKKCHPDKYFADKKRYELAMEETKRINSAYNYLSSLFEKNLIPKNSKNSEFKTRIVSYTSSFSDESVLEILLESSHTVSVSYDYEAHIMFIKFVNSKVYKFFGISPRVFEEFLTAKSHHKYAHRNIFFKYPYIPCH